MLFDQRRRVEEDLESIRRRFKEEAGEMYPGDSDESEADSGLEAGSANLFSADLAVPSGSVVSETAKVMEPTSENIVYEEPVRATPKDILAIVIAVFSLLLPFILVMLVVMGLFFLIFLRGIIF